MAFPHAAPVTPSDSAEINFKALFVGVGGTVVVTAERGSSTDNDVTYQNIASGDWILVQGSKVKATGTTASGIIRHW